MKTRNANAPKLTGAKKTPPAKKVPNKSGVAEAVPEAAVVAKTPDTNTTSVKTPDKPVGGLASTEPAKKTPDSDPKAATGMSSDSKAPLSSGSKTVKRIVKVVKKVPATTKLPSSEKPKTEGDSKIHVKEDVETIQIDTKVVESSEKELTKSIKKESSEIEMEEVTIESTKVRMTEEEEEHKHSDEEEHNMSEENTERPKIKMEVKEKQENNKEGSKNEAVNVDGSNKSETEEEYSEHDEDEDGGDEGDYGDRVELEDNGEDDFVESDPEDPEEEVEVLDEEHKELEAAAINRKIKRETEIFVGGLERSAGEEDVRKAFECIGEVIEIRMNIDPTTNKNKGYAFVKFTSKDNAQQALSEMKHPVICGKRCGIAQSEDNDTLFLGNICNTWTKEAIKQKLKDYGVGGVEMVTLIPDAQQEGRSRGFAFVEFTCHADAIFAYKRLQKPDVIFGHHERTAKVAFAEPIREPDPEVMAQVKTVFLDGIPPHWDEERITTHLKGYGDVERVVLARNMPTAKRNDFGFVDFATHHGADACINGINNTELVDGSVKMKVKARFSNPLPKTQAVKGGMRGGFRIGHTAVETFPRFGRGVVRGGIQPNRTVFPRGNTLFQRGHVETAPMHPQYDADNRYMLHGKQTVGQGGRRGLPRGAHYLGSRGMAGPPIGSSRAHMNRPWAAIPDRGMLDPIPPMAETLPMRGGLDRPFEGLGFDEAYYYNDNARGMKRPYYAPDHAADYVEPSRIRSRLNYSDPAASIRGARYRGNDSYSCDYRGSDVVPYSSYYGRDRPYGGSYFY